MAKIGFIGLGHMGLPMANNLKSAGCSPVCYDISEAACHRAKATEHQIAADMAEIATADIIILMLPNGTIVTSVVTKLLTTMSKGSLLIDCSTIDITSAKDIHDMSKTAGIHCLDAPVSGGVSGAEAGTLTFMVGGDDEAFSKGRDVLAMMGRKSVYCGPGGSGQAAKTCNNMLLAVSMIGACETFTLAEKLGLDQKCLFDVISTSSGSCWSVNSYCPVPDTGPQSPADHGYKPGFSASLMLKDLTLAMDAAHHAKTSTPLGAHAASLYKIMVDKGYGNQDFSAIIKLLSDLK